MSSKKRRAKRKIAQLVRMDQTRQRMPNLWRHSVAHQQQQAFIGCMAALGHKLARLGLMDRAIAAMKAAGTDMLDE